MTVFYTKNSKKALNDVLLIRSLNPHIMYTCAIKVEDSDTIDKLIKNKVFFDPDIIKLDDTPLSSDELYAILTHYTDIKAFIFNKNTPSSYIEEAQKAISRLDEKPIIISFDPLLDADLYLLEDEISSYDKDKVYFVLKDNKVRAYDKGREFTLNDSFSSFNHLIAHFNKLELFGSTLEPPCLKMALL